MRVSKKQTPRSQSIKIRGFHIGIATKTSDPIVEVIDRDKDDVRPVHGRIGDDRNGGLGHRLGNEEAKEQTDQDSS